MAQATRSGVLAVVNLDANKPIATSHEGEYGESDEEPDEEADEEPDGAPAFSDGESNGEEDIDVDLMGPDEDADDA